MTPCFRSSPVVVCALAACGLVWSGTDARAGDPPPLANNPLPPAFFSIDPLSPTIGPTVRPDGVLIKPGPMTAIQGVGLGLGRPGDNLDEISDRRSTPPTLSFALLFSVGRNSPGTVPPDPIVFGMGFPYNVQQQAALNQAHGDVFMTTELFNRNGPLLPPRAGPNNNVLVINQGDAGGVDNDLQPAVSPSTFVSPAAATDGLDGLGYADGSPARGLVDGLFYSVSRESPSLSFLPGTGSGADIYFDSNPLSPGGESLYAQPAALGLQQGDDIDGLLVFDNGNFVFEPGIDQILFSLAPNSPSLPSLGRGPADLFTSVPGGLALFAPSSKLGLGPADDLDALDILIGDNIDLMIQQRAIFPEPATAVLIALAAPLLRRRRA